MPTTQATGIKRMLSPGYGSLPFRVLLMAVGVGAIGAALFSQRSANLTEPVIIYQGVKYECAKLPDTAESGGVAHVVCVDLKHPGIELYLTPLDSQAVVHGSQYRLSYGSQVAQKEQLDVLINGALFSSHSGLLPFAGDLASGVDTVIADHQISHVQPHSYLLWFEDDLTPHQETNKPPPENALQKARWGIGGQGVSLKGGVVSRFAGNLPDRRTMVAIDSSRSLLWLAVFEHASGGAAAAFLAQRGAVDGILVDGGDSTTMVIGKQAALAKQGTMLGGYRPVATFFGIRARSVATVKPVK